MKICLYL